MMPTGGPAFAPPLLELMESHAEKAQHEVDHSTHTNSNGGNSAMLHPTHMVSGHLPMRAGGADHDQRSMVRCRTVCVTCLVLWPDSKLDLAG